MPWIKVGGLDVHYFPGDLPINLLSQKIGEAEDLMKRNLAESLYSDDKPREIPAAQAARVPGYYWTRYPGQAWSLDQWEYGCWSYVGHDDMSNEDPPEIIGPIEAPPS